MNIIDCYYILDGNLDAKQRKATEFFLEQNLVKLFGQAEFEEEEAKVMITPNSIEITNNVYGDETTKDIVIEVFKNGLLLEYGQDYTISGTTLTLTTALVSTDKIAVKVNDITSVPLSDIENLLNNLNSGDNE